MTALSVPYRLDVFLKLGPQIRIPGTRRILRKIADWLIDGARPSSIRFDGGGNLRAAGAGRLRVAVACFVRTLHPDILGLNFILKP